MNKPSTPTTTLSEILYKIVELKLSTFRYNINLETYDERLIELEDVKSLILDLINIKRINPFIVINVKFDSSLLEQELLLEGKVKNNEIIIYIEPAIQCETLEHLLYYLNYQVSTLTTVKDSLTQWG